MSEFIKIQYLSKVKNEFYYEITTEIVKKSSIKNAREYYPPFKTLKDGTEITEASFLTFEADKNGIERQVVFVGSIVDFATIVQANALGDPELTKKIKSAKSANKTSL